MSRSTLPKLPLPILGYRKDGRPIFPIMGGSEPHQGGQQNGQQQDGQQNGQQQQQNQEPAEATDEDGVGLGFPKDTAVDKMTADQKANYWRNQSKVQQKRVPADLDKLQQDAQAWREYQAAQNQQQNGQQQQNTPTREQIEAEIRADVSRDAALAILRTNLHTRGKNAEEIDDLLQYVAPDAFLTAEKKVDAAKVTTYLDRVAPSGSGGGGGGLPGQGNRNNGTVDKSADGKAESERRGFTKANSRSPLLPANS